MKAATVACILLLSSGLAMGSPSKRAVAPGEIVPQEDALLETGMLTEVIGGEEAHKVQGTLMESDVAIAVFQEANGAAVAVSMDDQIATTVQGVENRLSGRVSGFARLDTGDRHYAAVKMAEDGVWFKFAEGKSYLADGANTALGSITRLKQGQCLVIVTYKDAGLSEADNEALARTRAQNIKKALLGLKISSDRIVMLKPCVGTTSEQSFALFSDRVDLKVEEGVSYTSDELFTGL